MNSKLGSCRIVENWKIRISLVLGVHKFKIWKSPVKEKCLRSYVSVFDRQLLALGH
jgi:hypothetical protein